MDMETQQELIQAKKQKRPVKLYAIVSYQNEDGSHEIETLETSNSKDMKQKLHEVYGEVEYEIVGLFRGRKIETKRKTKVDFKIN